MMNYSNNLYIAVRAAIDAGKAIMDIYTDPASDFEIERKADNSPLTKADKAAHKLIMNVLSVTPYPILSEEGKDIPYAERSSWETFWLVDPLDGTKEFIKKNGEFTVNIALIQKGVPVLGVIYVPVRWRIAIISLLWMRSCKTQTVYPFLWHIRELSLLPPVHTRVRRQRILLRTCGNKASLLRLSVVAVA